MGNKGAAITAGFVATLAGAGALYASVKSRALKVLDKQGAFDEARAERREALTTIYGPEVMKHVRTDVAYPINDPATKPAVEQVNRRWAAKKREIAHQRHADTLSGAWNLLESGDKGKAVAFAGVTSVAAGGATYLITRKSKRGSGYGDDIADGIDGYVGDFGHHHHGGGFDHGWVDGLGGLADLGGLDFF